MFEPGVPSARARRLLKRAWRRRQEHLQSISFFTPVGNCTLSVQNLNMRGARLTILIVGGFFLGPASWRRIYAASSLAKNAGGTPALQKAGPLKLRGPREFSAHGLPVLKY